MLSVRKVMFEVKVSLTSGAGVIVNSCYIYAQDSCNHIEL
jgi:hypothetical protein